MRKLFKNLTAIGLSVTMVVGTASMASAAVANGTDVSTERHGHHILSIHVKITALGKISLSEQDRNIRIKRIHTRVMVKMQRLQHRHQAVLQ